MACDGALSVNNSQSVYTPCNEVTEDSALDIRLQPIVLL